MLPAIARRGAAAQIQSNSVLVEGPVNAFVGGLTEGLMGLIDGTKSAKKPLPTC